MYTEASYSKDNKNKSKLHLFMLTTAQRNLWWWLRTWACTLRARRNPLSALMQPTTGHDSKPEFAWHFMCAERLDLCLNFDPHWWHLKPATSLCVCNTYWTTSEHKKPYSGRNFNLIWCYLLNPTVSKLGTRHVQKVSSDCAYQPCRWRERGAPAQ
jgi:hypothetical protein